MSAAVSSDVAIFDRAVSPSASAFSLELARHWLSVKFSESDRQRMAELAAAARAGTLTPSERDEIESYERVGAMLGSLQARARARLRAAGA